MWMWTVSIHHGMEWNEKKTFSEIRSCCRYPFRTCVLWAGKASDRVWGCGCGFVFVYESVCVYDRMNGNVRCVYIFSVSFNDKRQIASIKCFNFLMCCATCQWIPYDTRILLTTDTFISIFKSEIINLTFVVSISPTFKWWQKCTRINWSITSERDVKDEARIKRKEKTTTTITREQLYGKKKTMKTTEQRAFYWYHCS